MIVVDASLVVAALTDDQRLGKLAEAAMAADPYWTAPELLRPEVTSAIRGRWLAGKLAEARADKAVRTLNQMTIRYAPWDDVADRVWELRHNLTPYDAAYVALAEARGCRVVTADHKLRNCALRRCPVDVVRPPQERR